MKLTTIREIYKNREVYLDKEVTVGGWVRSAGYDGWLSVEFEGMEDCLMALKYNLETLRELV